MDKSMKLKGWAVRLRVNIDGKPSLHRISGPAVWVAAAYMILTTAAAVASFF
jgi:hypothetical protein